MPASIAHIAARMLQRGDGNHPENLLHGIAQALVYLESAGFFTAAILHVEGGH
jgi:hypothetical protein